MLILARKTGESIAIDNNIKIRVLEIKGGLVKLGIEAPNHVAVHREEIYLRLLEQNRKAALEAPLDLTELTAVLKNTLKNTPFQDMNNKAETSRKDKEQE